ncbi:MAG: tetratricopeptide repeat protein [Deltaproteobacteria bacterium]
MSADVLLVEADASSSGLIAHGLARRGLSVLPVAPERALDAVRLDVPGLIIADAGPDGGPSHALVEAIRNDPRLAAVPVVLLGKGARPLGESAIALGAAQFLERPIFVQDVAVLGRLHAGHPASEERFAGELDGLGAYALVRGLLAGGRSGELYLDAVAGRISFKKGRVVDAVLPSLEGERALTPLLSLSTGRYRLLLGETAPEGKLSIGAPELASRFLPRTRRWGELGAALGPLDAVYELAPERLESASADLPAPLRPLLDRFDGARTVAAVLAASDSDELTTAGAIAYLRSLDLLRAPIGETPSAPEAAPTLELADIASSQAEAIAVSSVEESFFDTTAELSELPAPVPGAGMSPVTSFGLGFVAVLAAVGGVTLLVWPSGKSPSKLPEPAPLTLASSKPLVDPAASATALKPLAALPIAPPAVDVDALLADGQKAYDQGKFALAASTFEQAVQAAPSDSNALLSLGMARYDLGQLREAMAPLEQARALSHNPRASLMLGAVYQELGERGRAKERYEEYLKLDPAGTHDGEVRSLLKSLAAR